MAATVIAVPSPITKVDATPIQNSPCASANTSTMIAPEHGRRPTATIAVRPRLSQWRAGEFAAAPVRARGSRLMLVLMVVVMIDAWW